MPDPHDSILRDHQAWLGYLQPDGLVVSPSALADMQVILDRSRYVGLQETFQRFVSEVPIGADNTATGVSDLQGFLRDFLEWPDELVHGFSDDKALPESLSVPLRDFGENLTASFAFHDYEPRD